MPMGELVQEKPSGWYKIARIFAALVFNTLCPITYHHPERADMDAPFILIANHKCWLDPICVAYVIPRYEVRFLAKKELVENKLIGGILRNMRAIGVDRHHSDMMAMRQCLKVVKEGQILGIFPEGTRHKKGVMEELEGGTAMIALRSGVPVLPMWIDGKIRLFHRTNCYIGEPIPLEDLRAQGIDRQVCQQVLERITLTYAQMRADKLAAPAEN